MKKCLYWFLGVYVSLLPFSCASYRPFYIGNWMQQPNTNNWANAKYMLYQEFPDNDWMVFPCPHDSLEKWDVAWPDPNLSNNTYTILMAVEFDRSAPDMLLTLDSTRMRNTNRVNPLGQTTNPFFNRLRSMRSIYRLEVTLVSEHTDLEAYLLYLRDTFNKIIKNDEWLWMNDMKDVEIEEIENVQVVRNDRNYMQMRYRIKNKKKITVPVHNYLVIGFKLSDKIALAQFFFEEDEFSYRVDEYYQLVSTIKPISSQEEFAGLTQMQCGENELLLKSVSSGNYSDAMKIRALLVNGKSMSTSMNKRASTVVVCMKVDVMPEIRRVVRKLNVNQISEIVNVNSTYYIIQRLR